MDALDPVDAEILANLQRDGRMSNVELAETVHLSPPAAHARVRRLTAAGIIRGYSALVDHEKLGFDMICFINVTLQLHNLEGLNRFRERVNAMPEVLECHHVTGEHDYLVKVVVKNRADLERVVVRELTPIPGVARICTSLVLSEIKSTTVVPVRPATAIPEEEQ